MTAQTMEGLPPLALAARAGNLKLLVALLDAGAPVNFEGDNTHTALSMAAMAGKVSETKRGKSDTSAKRSEPPGRWDILSPLPRLVPARGIFSLPFHDWCPLRVYSPSLSWEDSST